MNEPSPSRSTPIPAFMPRSRDAVLGWALLATHLAVLAVGVVIGYLIAR